MCVAVAAHVEVFSAEYAQKSVEWQSHQVLMLRLLMGIPERHLQLTSGPAPLQRLLLDFLHVRTDIAPPVSLLSRIGQQSVIGACIFSRFTSEASLPSHASVVYQVLLVNAPWSQMFPFPRFATGQVMSQLDFEQGLSRYNLDLHRLCRSGRRVDEQRAVWSPSRGYRLLGVASEFVLETSTVSERREVFFLHFEDLTVSSRIEESLLYSQLQAHRSEKLRQTLVASVAHELRTPLTAIAGFADLAQERMQRKQQRVRGGEADSNGDVAVVEMLEDIRTASQHLLQTVTDLLDVSRLAVQPQRVSRVDVSQVVRDAACWAMEAMRKKQIDLHVTLPMEGDESDSVVSVTQQHSGSSFSASSLRRSSWQSETLPSSPVLSFTATEAERERHLAALSPAGRLRALRREVEQARPQPTQPTAERMAAVMARHRPVWVDGDGVALKRAMINLLDNAMKFTSAGGRVDVLLRPLPPSAVDRRGFVCISVIDRCVTQHTSTHLLEKRSVTLS